MMTVKRGIIAAEPCCCGDPEHERPAYEAWIATDPDYPGFMASTTKSAARAEEALLGAIERFTGEAQKTAIRLRTTAPDTWYGEYREEWQRAHGPWARAGLEPGQWQPGWGDIWCSSTLQWDHQWFLQHGVEMPTQFRHVSPLDTDPGDL